MRKLLSIGDFSKASQLTLKTLRFYHEKGILVPERVEAGTGYRFYSASQIERANVIRQLRDLGFSVREIQDLLQFAGDEHDIVAELESKHAEVKRRVADDRRTQQRLATIITQVKEERALMADTTFEIEEKDIEPVLVAAKRMRGKYSDCGQGFKAIGKRFGFKINGKPMLLCHDGEYKEDDADFSACMPVSGGANHDDIEVYELPAGKAVTLVHKGPYDTLRVSYEKLLAHIASEGYSAKSPSREVYLKGPGMIFQGNPNNYLTEIQFLVE
ncbi:MAG: MerR family transcriptional regulator [Planctomycetota bacterium]